MASVDRQQHALEVLKFINKAITNIRLYPEQSVQVSNTVEKAYSELKTFLRLYGTLNFGLHKGVPTLDGVIFERKGREQLDDLSLVDFLDKAGLRGMTLAQGLDRKRFKQVLSFFTTHHEQIQKSGGIAAFVKDTGLGAVFLEDSDNDVAQEQIVTLSFSDYLQQIMANGVRQDQLLSLLRHGEERPQSEEIRKELTGSDKGVDAFIAAVCFVLQDLQWAGAYGVSPGFNQLLENMSAALKDEEIQQIAGGAASKLALNLDKVSMALLFCQTFATHFGESLFATLVAVIDKELFRSLIDFLRHEGERLDGSLDQADAESSQLVNESCQRLMETVKGRQLHAIEIMGMTEKQRQSKRLQAGLIALTRGNLEGLRNKEILLHLPVTFERLIKNKRENVAAAIIQTLVGGLKLEDEELRFRSGQSLGLIGERLVALDYWGWLEKLTSIFLFWVRRAEAVDDVCTCIVGVLQKILTHAQKIENEDLVDKILPLFYAIRSGVLRKTVEMRNLVGQIQDKAVDRSVLQAYLDQSFVKPVQAMCCQKIVMHGPLGIQFLLDALLTNNKRPERIRLLKILAGVGGELSSLLLARLQEPMPWYGKRNLIRLLAATGDEGDLVAVQGYLTHDDLRVQSEALSCIYKLSDQKKKQYLLEALPLISEKLKFQVVQALAEVVDEEVVGVLVELLQDEKYFSDDIRTTLLVSICETLGRSGSAQAKKALQLMLGTENAPSKKMAKEVWQAAQRGLLLLDVSRRQQKERHSEIQKSLKSAVRSARAGQERSGAGYIPVTNLAEEQEIYTLLDQNKKAVAKGLLLDLISTMSYLRQFEQAEVLCQRLIEIDPLAMEDIIQATELVEEQRAASGDQGQSLSWVGLYDFLTTEEFNTFYSSMEHLTFNPDENIVAQGDLQQRLFFINKGRVKLFSRDLHGNDILLKTVGPGEIFGVDSFFKASVWTVNAASVGTVDVFVLPHEALRKWQNSFPALELKLKDFCQQLVEHDALKVMAIDRRGTERLKLSGRLAMAILDDKGKKTGTVLQGENGDVSIGGISSMVRISQKRNIRLLLGRKIFVSLPDGPAGNQLTSGMAGLVVAIYVDGSIHGESAAYVHYSVHIQFDQPIQEADLAAVASGG
ncbi:MAG: cyclic nucleotide-binding domain-containing protein [Proteobacteria bacterium]|nr:cyclic nucleotide-binding domain-containing protein [Pseudomonadota bacterium]MBU1648900.1 cyclic nucleotide-binding domain-containing protein [Pseudomonadota bacterium]MBU1986111.1 cyclic nucleotide-binding domain-containing protein [Pseudomonadota bacterium]